MPLISTIFALGLLAAAPAESNAPPMDRGKTPAEFPIERLKKLYPDDHVMAAPDAAGDPEERTAYARYLAFRLLAASEDYSAAEQALKEALSIRPADVEITLGAIRLSMDSGDYQKAARQAEEAVAEAPQSVEARLALAEAHRMQQMKTGAPLYRQLAASHYEAARELAPKDLRILIPLGQYYWDDFRRSVDDQARSERAVKVIDIHQAIFDVSRPRDRLLPLLRIAFAHKETGALDEAIGCFQLATQISPYNTDILLQLGRLFEEAGRSDEAVATYRRGLIIDPSSATLVAQVDALLGRKSDGSLLRFYGDLASDFPVNPEMQRLFAQHLARLGELDKAEEVFQKVIDLDAGDVESRFALIGILIQHNQLDGALRQLAEVESLFADNPEILTDAAGGLMALERTADAERVMRRAVEAATEENRALYVRRLARLLSDSGQLEAAIAALEETRQLRPDDAANYTLMKQFYLDHGKRSDALRVLGEALESLPESEQPDFYVQRAEMYEVDGKNELALADLDAALPIAGEMKRVEILLLRADIMAELKRFPEAESILRELQGAIENEAFENVRRLRLAYLFEQARKPDAAETEYRSLILDNPTFLDAYVRLSRLLIEESRPEDAERLYEDLLRHNGDSPQAFLVASAHFSEQGRFERALAVLDEALTRFSMDEPYYLNVQRGSLLGDIGRYEEAESIFKGLIEDSPLQTDAYLSLGMLYDKIDRLDDAERMYRQVIQIDPKEPNAYNNLGYMWAARGIRLDEARKLIEKAMEIEPGVPAYIDSLGWTLYQQGDYDGAVRELEIAVEGLEKSRENAEVYEHLGDAYVKVGRTEDARRIYRKTLEIHPGRPGIEEKLEKLK